MRKNQCGNFPNDERYTPAAILDLARSVMGAIDVDPASCEAAQNVVQARHWYSISNSGLDVQWNGKVWLNPPYSHGLYARFIEHLIREILAGRVTEAITLTNNNTDTRATQALMQIASGVCFQAGRIAFHGGGLTGKTGGICGQMICYYGPHADAFFRAFAAVGVCVRVVQIPREKS